MTGSETGGGPSSALLPVAVVDRLSFRYGGAACALRDVSFDVRQGEALAALGPNGAGKSTLIANLLGLLAPASGSVEILGRPPQVATREGLVTAMFQETGLPAFATVGEVLRLVARLYPRPLEVHEAARLAGVEELLGRMVTRLSGGQRRRVQFAMTLVANADFLVLDEPTEGLDIEARTRLWEILRRYRADRSGRTVVFTTHDLSEADRFADRILLLNRGRVVALGSPESLKAERTASRVRFRAQAGATAGELASRTGHPVRESEDGWFEVSDADTDRVIRELVGLDLPLRDFRVSPGTLDEVFRALTCEEGGGDRG